VDDFLVQANDAEAGAFRWQDRTFVGTDFDNQAAAVDDEGKWAFVAGWVRWIPGTMNQEAFLVRAYNMKTGALDWEDQYPGPGLHCLCQAHDIVVQGARAIAVGGGLVSGGANVFIVRTYDAKSRNLLWQNESPTDGFRESNLAVAVDQGVVFAAETRILRAYDGK
jgi:hypothetical protein